MITASWMYGDAGLLGQAVARRSPWRWSRSAKLPDVVAELQGLPDRWRPVRIVVRNWQEAAGQHKRSRTKVEQCFAGADGAVAALQALLGSVPEAAVDGLSPIPSLVSQSSCESCARDLSGAGASLARDADEQALQETGSSPLLVLRAHLSTGSPVLARWMWGDAGLTAVLPKYSLVAEANPWRWSRSLALETTMADLDSHLASGSASRPVRLHVWSSSGGQEESTCVHFATTAQNVAIAGSIVGEIHLMVRQAEQEPELPWSSEDSFHSFATESWALSRPSRSRSWVSAVSREGSSGTPTGSTALGGSVPLGQISLPPAAVMPQPRRRPPTNSNRVSQYAWLVELLEMITGGSAAGAARDLDSRQRATPLFVVAGFCPNSFAGMQAVVYNQLSRGIDFWWAKPQEDDPRRLERATLDLHSAGRHKNAAGKSRAVYAPLAEKFRGVSDQGDFAFGVEGGRAFIEERKGTTAGQRLLLYFVWQENWSSLFARRKFIEGKICYQRSKPGGQTEARLFARQFRIQDGQLDIATAECEEEVPSLLPPDSFQEMYET